MLPCNEYIFTLFKILNNVSQCTEFTNAKKNIFTLKWIRDVKNPISSNA
jgi:hypothetical protein